MSRVLKEVKFDFNDLLIVPANNSEITSRYGDIQLDNDLPLMTAPMDTVIDMKNAKLFSNLGIDVIIPRTETKDWFEYEKHIIEINKNNYFVSLGLQEFKELSHKIAQHEVVPPKRVLLDIANGHIKQIVDYAKNIKAVDNKIEIMVGSIANPETYVWLAKSGVIDYVRCGIGAGNGCLTTKNAAIGYPMASLIYECRKEKEKLKKEEFKNLPAIVADGGMKDYADVIKGLGLGADYVILGSIFNIALESSGNCYWNKIKLNKSVAKYLYKRGFKIRKYFRGMSTKEAQKAMGKTILKTSEGVIRYRPVKYTLNGWVENFNHYLRNAMSYTNCVTIDKFIGGVEFSKITDFAYKRFDK